MTILLVTKSFFIVFYHAAQWSLAGSGIALSDAALTSVAQNFTSVRYLRGGVLFPLVVAPNTFQTGMSYVFRLTTTSIEDPSAVGFGDITVYINAAPSSGGFQVSPVNGTAVTTKFSMSAFSWVDDPSAYPITYAFAYALSANQTSFRIQGASELSYTSTTLPSGILK